MEAVYRMLWSIRKVALLLGKALAGNSMAS